MRRSVIALLGLAVIAASPAFAEPVSARISVTAADLTSQESVAAVYQRVEDAAAAICAEIISTAPGAPAYYASPQACSSELARTAIANSGIEPLVNVQTAARAEPGDILLVAAR